MAWIVRHGESTWNVLGIVQGHADQAVLTRRGQDQARAAAAQLAGRPIGALYSSDLQRARETAYVVAQSLGLPVRTDPALRERCLGVLEGGPVSALTPEVAGIRGDEVIDVDARPAGGESLADLQHRVAGFADRLRQVARGRDVVVVAHGGSVRALRACCAGLPIDAASWDAVPNGSVWGVPLAASKQREGVR